MNCSRQLAAYLRARRGGASQDNACAASGPGGFCPSEARLIDIDEARGLLADLDITEPRAAGNAAIKEDNTMENFDPITGEVLQPAADGGRLRPAASTLGQFLAFLEDGQFDADVAVDLKEMAATLQDIAATQGTAKSKLTIEVDFKINNGMFIISAKHKIKMPEEVRAASVAWTTEDNRFTPHKPNQGQLFGVRDVSSGSALRTL